MRWKSGKQVQIWRKESVEQLPTVGNLIGKNNKRITLVAGMGTFLPLDCPLIQKEAGVIEKTLAN